MTCELTCERPDTGAATGRLVVSPSVEIDEMGIGCPPRPRLLALTTAATANASSKVADMVGRAAAVAVAAAGERRRDGVSGAVCFSALSRMCSYDKEEDTCYFWELCKCEINGGISGVFFVRITVFPPIYCICFIQP